MTPVGLHGPSPTGSSFWPPVDTAGHRAGSNQHPVFAVQCVGGGKALGACVTRPPAAQHMACTRFSSSLKDTKENVRNTHRKDTARTLDSVTPPGIFSTRYTVQYKPWKSHLHRQHQDPRYLGTINFQEQPTAIILATYHIIAAAFPSQQPAHLLLGFWPK